ncbi:MAG TPA: LysR family transcriptional regulator [Falsiroseomonas sp.]|jgi:DNA-binding transcriptional LysR family regulator|nr:LysR family transcriptional regulator [Falsiroseomonas sp.]
MQTADFRLLGIFAAVAEAGSMSRAATRLQLSQPAVSQAVARLEAALGCAMFDRSRRPLRLTEEGQVALRAAQELVQGIAALPERIRAVRQLPLRLRLGVVDSLTFPFLPALCTELGRHVEFLSVSSGLVQTLRDSLMAGALDFVISNDAMEDLDRLTRHEILREPYILAVPSSLRDPASLSLESLARSLPLMRWGRRSLLARDVEVQLRRLRLAVPQKFDLESAGALLGMVAAGLGWAVVTPLAVLQAANLGPRVALLPFPGPGFSRSITLVAPRSSDAELPLQIADASRRVVQGLVAAGAFHAMPFAEIRIAAEEPAARTAGRRVPGAGLPSPGPARPGPASPGPARPGPARR